MARLKRVFQSLLFPAWWIVLVSVPLAAAGLIFAFAPANRGHWLTYPAYTFSAYALTIVCACIVKNAGHARQDVNAAMDRVPVIRRYLTEPEFQVRVSLYRSLASNLGYVVWNLFCGIWYRSIWFGTLAGYHLLLTLMRFSLLRYARHHAFGEELRTEWRRYRFCGAVLLAMNLALTGVVIMVVQDQKGFSYPGYHLRHGDLRFLQDHHRRERDDPVPTYEKSGDLCGENDQLSRGAGFHADAGNGNAGCIWHQRLYPLPRNYERRNWRLCLHIDFTACHSDALSRRAGAFNL